MELPPGEARIALALELQSPPLVLAAQRELRVGQLADDLVEERETVEEGEKQGGGGWEVAGRALADGSPEIGRHRRFEPLHGSRKRGGRERVTSQP